MLCTSVQVTLYFPCMLNLQFLQPKTLLPRVGNCLSKYLPYNVIVNWFWNLFV